MQFRTIDVSYRKIIVRENTHVERLGFGERIIYLFLTVYENPTRNISWTLNTTGNITRAHLRKRNVVRTNSRRQIYRRPLARVVAAHVSTTIPVTIRYDYC